MTDQGILALARDAGFSERNGVIRTVHSNGSWVGINAELLAFANAIIAKHTEELLKGVGEPAAFVVALPGRPISMTVPVAQLDRLTAMHNEPLYTATQLAATVAIERKKLDALVDMAIGAEKDYIAELESALRVAAIALEDYSKYTKGVMIPTTRWQGEDAIKQIKEVLHD